MSPSVRPGNPGLGLPGLSLLTVDQDRFPGITQNKGPVEAGSDAPIKSAVQISFRTIVSLTREAIARVSEDT